MTSESQVDRLTNDISMSLLHSANILYFVLLIANIVHKTLSIPIKGLSDGVFDGLAIICFFLGVISFSFSSLLPNNFIKSSESVGILVSAWGSAIPFFYFQFYHTKWVVLVFSLLISLSGARCAACALRGEDKSSKISFAAFAILALAPAVYSCTWETNCRYPVAMEYIKYLCYHAFGAITFFVGFFGNFDLSHSLNSRFAMHLILIGGAIIFSNHLLDAYLSSKAPSNIRCQGLLV